MQLTTLLPSTLALPFDGSLASQRLLSQAQEQAATPNPLIYLDIWLFGGLVLVVMLVVIARYLWRNLRPDSRDPSEGLQPWEDPDYDYDRDYDPDHDPDYDLEEDSPR